MGSSDEFNKRHAVELTDILENLMEKYDDVSVKTWAAVFGGSLIRLHIDYELPYETLHSEMELVRSFCKDDFD